MGGIEIYAWEITQRLSADTWSMVGYSSEIILFQAQSDLIYLPTTLEGKTTMHATMAKSINTYCTILAKLQTSILDAFNDIQHK